MQIGRWLSAAALFLVALVSPASAQSPEPFAGLLGTWHLNAGASQWNPAPAPYARATWKIEPDGDGVKMTYDLVGTRGGVTHMEWSGRFDSRDYQIQGPDSYVTYAYTPVGGGTFDLVVKAEGNIAASGRLVLSPDGRRLTTQMTSRSARLGKIVPMTVYEKR
jgi:hypothetical protein